MNEREDIDMLAAEYALGTLDAAERASVELRRKRDADLDSAIVAWEGRLAPLGSQTAPIAPSDSLLARIQARIDAITTREPSVDGALILPLQKRVFRWRMATAATAALAACLAIVLLVRETSAPSRPDNFVAVFNANDTSPAFVLSIDLRSREVVIRPVAAQRQPGKDYQLWIVAKPLGPAPRSLGLLDESLEPTRKRLADFEPAVLQSATFGISLEPEGGSPTGQPTGPALHGRLIPATP